MIGAGSVLGSFLISLGAFWHMMNVPDPARDLPIITNYFTWIQAGTFQANAGFMLDHLSGLMILIVAAVAAMVLAHRRRGAVSGPTTADPARSEPEVVG